MATNSTCVTHEVLAGVVSQKTNSTRVTHEVLARAESKGLVLYIKGAKKFGKKLFLSPMSGSCPGTLLSPTRWEVQFQDVVLEQKHYYNEKCVCCSRHYIIIVLHSKHYCYGAGRYSFN